MKFPIPVTESILSMVLPTGAKMAKENGDTATHCTG